MVMNWEVTGRNSESIPAMQKCIKDYKTLRPYFYGDYYPLTGTDNMTQDNVWLSYQLNRPAQGDGIIIAFRRKDCNEESIIIRLRGIDPKVSYELTDVDTNLVITKTGEELIKGLTLSAKEKPGSLLIMYKMATTK